MTAPSLARQQRRVSFLDPTRLHDRWHGGMVVYNVNDVKPDECYLYLSRF